MLENDYLMRMILLFIRFLKQALGQRHVNPREASQQLENQIADAVNIDAELFFSLAPESMVTLLQLGGFDERLAEYMVRAFAFDASLLDEANMQQHAELRRNQMQALALAYGKSIDEQDLLPEAILNFVEQSEQQYLDDQPEL